MENLESLSLVDLRLLAKKMGIKGVTGYRKQELLDLLKEETKKQASVEKNEPKVQREAKVQNESKIQKEAKAQNEPKARVIKGNSKTDDAGKRSAYNKKAMQRYNEKMGGERREMPTKRENRRVEERTQEQHTNNNMSSDIEQLDSGEVRKGILEVMSEGYGFIRCDNYLPGEEDIYVSPALIRKYHLRTGDILEGNVRVRNQNEKFAALLYIKKVNGYPLEKVFTRAKFEQLTPIFPNERIHLETPGSSISMRMMDLISPIGKGQRGMIVSQPKTGKTTLLKQVAKAVKANHPKMHLIVLLIDERPEEVTDIKESIMGNNVEVIYSTFDELPENHKRVSEMVIERAKRLVEHGEDVMILLDSITRLARAYNLTVQPSGRTLSGGLDPAALHMPKRFFGAARNMREGGSLTILATALVDTGSKMDDVVFEEFKGTGNMELVLDRKLSEKRVFPAIDLPKSSTRREDLLLTQEELEATNLMRKAFNGVKSEEAVERIIELFRRTKNNQEFTQMIKKVKIV
ncbi:MAG: transcription termination factor Rho [Butyribacter sp.]|nr:transcription termination factor Rho [bacterium]MDY3853571.1 transcription termination factor Rho [Butyribacter sp.]